MTKNRPARGSHAPGTFWYYNNWDFNVLGTISEKKTRTQDRLRLLSTHSEADWLIRWRSAPGRKNGFEV